MSKKKPCGLDYCPQEEIVGAYASCSACAWGAENESKDKSKRLTELETLVTDEILRSDDTRVVRLNDHVNYTWADYLGEGK